MCNQRFTIIISVLSYAAVFGASELNETTYASLPPLYGLDNWLSCRRPGDVYCMVDAVLLPNSSSTLMNLLEDYSNVTLKHYNRTQIHRGVCVSRCGVADGPGDWRTAAQVCVNQSMQEFGLEAQVLSTSWCSSSDPEPASSSARSLGVICIAIVVITFLATGLHILGERCAKADGNKFLLAFSIMRNWSIMTYDRSKPRKDERMKDLACIEGVRFLGIQCVIFSHVILIYVYSYIDNPQFIEKMYDHFGWKLVLNSPLWLQAFFSLSGFLTAYSVLITSEKRNLTFPQCLMSIINRYIRLTPIAVLALWFTIAWYPLMGAGPQWAWIVEREAHDCSERWWYHVLYVHNHIPLGKFCMGHTWYLAADMQLHIFGILLLLLLVRYRSAVIPVLCTFVAASAAAAGLVVYFYDLTPIITAQSPEILRTMFLGSRILPILYLPSWMNLAGYLGGIATAFIHHHNQINGVKLNESKVFNILFHAALTLGGTVVLAGVVFLSDSPPPNWAAALYSSFDRLLVAIFFNVFLLGCLSRCKSVFRDMLMWRGFHVLGRLSYCAYVIHFIILRFAVANNTQLGHASLFSMISLLIIASVLTYLVSIPCCLLIELPAIQLWKALVESEPERPVEPAPRSHAPAKFDLVAHTNRV
ncbi:nose resistant to fluoxetine protein 6-like [Epargyreus clarus]|uniref:nose resistant to fluoxetine protein 6-like n=1 Tax=Epargyreus clarus TaxID=520877 RepID=UPI003C2D4AB5